MNATREMMKDEAILRLKLLNVRDDILQEFIESDVPNNSYYGEISYLSEDIQAIVKEFSEKTGYLVYHTIYNHTGIGDMLSVLFVTPYPNEWELDRNDIKEDVIYCRVINLQDPYLSDFGSIGIQKIDGTVWRRW